MVFIETITRYKLSSFPHSVSSYVLFKLLDNLTEWLVISFLENKAHYVLDTYSVHYERLRLRAHLFFYDYNTKHVVLILTHISTFALFLNQQS
jgi:hypothetical protein